MAVSVAPSAAAASTAGAPVSVGRLLKTVSDTIRGLWQKSKAVSVGWYLFLENLVETTVQVGRHDC